MHEAEATLASNRKTWDAYEDNLVEICMEDAVPPAYLPGEIYHFHASAEQRAEAFVLTMEKYESNNSSSN